MCACINLICFFKNVNIYLKLPGMLFPSFMNIFNDFFILRELNIFFKNEDLDRFNNPFHFLRVLLESQDRAVDQDLLELR